MPAFIITRIQVGDYDAWRPMFDQDRPQAREKARVQSVFRGIDDPEPRLHLPRVRLGRGRSTRRSNGCWHRASSIGSRTRHGPNLVEEVDSIHL